MVNIVRFAVRQDQQKLLSVGLFGKLCCCVTDGGSHARVETGLQRRNPVFYGRTKSFVEVLYRFDPHP